MSTTYDFHTLVTNIIKRIITTIAKKYTLCKSYLSYVTSLVCYRATSSLIRSLMLITHYMHSVRFFVFLTSRLSKFFDSFIFSVSLTV